MRSEELLAKIKSVWLNRVANNMARGPDLRANFQIELEQFYSRLEQAVSTGDPAWLDEILRKWSLTPTQSNIEQGITVLLSQMIRVTNDVAQELLDEKETLELLTTLIPIYTHWMDKAARLEMETRIGYISKELTDVQKQLERLDRTKSTFISVAAHELKTPLTLVEGYTSMMREMISQSEQAQLNDLFEGMNKGVRRLHEIIDDMIDVSIIDTGLLVLNYQQTTIGHILKLLKTDLALSLDERQQELIIDDFPGSETWVYADPERVYQAIYHVLTNAIKYTPDKGKIFISGRTLPGFIEITIKDTGIGISAEYQATIFEKFSQLGRTNLHSSGKTKFKGGGPGLGLPITRGILEAHGGSIWVESPGFDERKLPGSTFHLLLPIQTEIPKIMNSQQAGQESLATK
jgi:signal transduction histidine kinase